jgi:hypothetical protein
MKKILAIFLLVFTVSFVNAQGGGQHHVFEFSSGVDFVSGFIWRGLDFGSAPAIQPNAAIEAFGFELSAFASYALMANVDQGFDKVPYSEFDLEFKYSIPTSAGKFSIIASDIFMPFLGLVYSNYDGVVGGIEEGAQWLSIGIGYEGTRHFPLSLRVDYHFHNDANKSIYAELGYKFVYGRNMIDLFCGVATGTNSDLPGSVFYEIEDDKIGFINVGGSISRNIRVTDSFHIPLKTSVVFNPNANIGYLVCSLSL